MKITESNLPYNYKTIHVTQSRINKGVLAIPISLFDYFPSQKTKLHIITPDTKHASLQYFSPFSKISKESRISGMTTFYKTFNVKHGDELVIQRLDETTYRIFTEKQFTQAIIELEHSLDHSTSDIMAEKSINKITELVNLDYDQAVLSEYYRLSCSVITMRKQHNRMIRKKESIKPAIRKLLEIIYKGKCQVTGFGFIARNGLPYFEVHHLSSEFGDHLKNILVVSPNVHAQFTHAIVEEFFDENDWLRSVKFNGREFHVNQAIDTIPKDFNKEIHFCLEKT